MVDKLNKITPEETDKKRKKQFNKILKQVADKIGHGKGTLKKHYLVPELPYEFIEHGKVIDIKDFGYAMADGGKIKSEQKESTPLVIFQEHYAKHGALFGGGYF